MSTRKTKQAIDWFFQQSPDVQRRAIEQLVEFAIDAEFIGIWADPEGMAIESGKSVSDYEAPYFRSCGEPLGSEF